MYFDHFPSPLTSNPTCRKLVHVPSEKRANLTQTWSLHICRSVSGWWPFQSMKLLRVSREASVSPDRCWLSNTHVNLQCQPARGGQQPAFPRPFTASHVNLMLGRLLLMTLKSPATKAPIKQILFTGFGGKLAKLWFISRLFWLSQPSSHLPHFTQKHLLLLFYLSFNGPKFLLTPFGFS